MQAATGLFWDHASEGWHSLQMLLHHAATQAFKLSRCYN